MSNPESNSNEANNTQDAEEEQIQNEEEEQNFNAEEGDDDFSYGNDDDDDYCNVDQQSGNSTDISFGTASAGGNDDNLLYSVLAMINACRAYYVGLDFENYLGGKITFKIQTSILPLSVSVFNGFNQLENLAEISLELDQENPWTFPPVFFEAKNDIYGKSFPGSLLIQNRVKAFFSDEYKPKSVYRCQSYVLAPQNIKRPANFSQLISQLLSEGFTKRKSEKALEFCSFDINKAHDYLISGILEPTQFNLPITVKENPLFYLVLEICESFFDMCYCCFNCGKELGVYSLKPSSCNDVLCQHTFVNVGVGSNIVGEIKRDKYVVDFIISLASVAYYAPKEPPVFDPSPESEGIKMPKDFFSKLPSMEKICSKCKNDQELISFIGYESFCCLRFFIVAMKAQFITLDTSQHVGIKNFKGFQFLASFVSPESELTFIEKKKEFGVKWFFHGSSVDRWYMILHTGLKDMGRTRYVQNGGPWFGDGIYMSDEFSVSYSYSRSCKNMYKNSMLPKNLVVMSLIENAAVPELNGPVAPNEFTQRDEGACITRVLFVMNFDDYTCPNLNSLTTPPVVPNLRDVLKFKLTNSK